ncbi:MAG: DUF120 domain-containing protein [Candidatus Thermoplasmatota archaeon]|nr:DUF120 domain-containing protein [Candidatus Thermoplasmatota archaeon]
MTAVILDTNALLMPFQFDLNLDAEIERVTGERSASIYVPSSVKDELEGLNEETALRLSEKYREVEVEKEGDEGVLEAAKKLDAMVVTNDKELKERALKEKLPVAYLRSKTHLELEGENWLLTKNKREKIDMSGKITSGTKKGKYFLSLEGYKKRFKDRFGFEPFEGTLNVKLKGEDLNRYERVKDKEGKTIEGFSEEDKEFGAIECFPSEVEKKDKRVGSNTFLVVPEKTRYDRVMEIVSEHGLRERLDLEDGDQVKILVKIQ